MNGVPGGTVDKIADNAWLKMIERLAVPLIGLIVWQMYTDITSIKAQFPVIVERVKNLETRADKFDLRADAARTERLTQYQSVIVEIAQLKQHVSSMEEGINDQRTLLRDISNKITRPAK